MTHRHSVLAQMISVGLCLFGLGPIDQAVFGASGPATITQQPSSITVVQGSPATFSVGVDGTPPFFYQWLRGGVSIAGATNNSYTLAATASGDNGAVFSASVSNALGKAVSSNAVLLVDPGTIVTQTVTLLTVSNAWRYNQLGYSLGTDWRNSTFDDSGWSNGLGVFDAKNNSYRTTIAGETVRTGLSTNSNYGKITTYYFRTHVLFTNANVTSVQFKVWSILDDGMILHLNGKEMFPYYVNSGAAYADWATRTVSDAAYEGPFDVPATNLVMGDNVIAAEVHQVNAGSSDATFAIRLDAVMTMRAQDNVPPVVSSQVPPAAATVRSLETVEVFFSEPVQGVDASDLLINGVPATNVVMQNSMQYVFEFPPPPTGMVQVAWSASSGIRDLAATPNAFAGGSWFYIVDPNALPPSVVINEFMAKNTSGLRDQDGDYSDWIELYNAGTTPVSLQGWSLTDLTNNIGQWRFPNVTMQAGAYLVVFASGKNRTNAAGQLHTSFQLAAEGEYLGLYDASGSVVSEFAPHYPPQTKNISYGRDRQNLSIVGYFVTPTPGAANSTSGAGFAPEVQYSRAGGTFMQPFQLTLSTTNVNAVIRYVLVTNAASAAGTNVPTETSPIYTSPIPIAAATQVRARAFQTNLFPGTPRTETYILLDASAATVSSDLPIVLFYNFGAGGIPSTYVAQPGIIAVFEPTVNGRAYLTNTPVLCERMGMHLRGSSTLGQPKGNFALEFWDEYNDEANVELLGMPAESDWVFYASDNFEPVLIHNAYMHQLSRDVGRYSPRTRTVEVYLNTAGGAVTVPSAGGGNYNGVYIVEEKIKVGKDRVDIDKLELENTTEPSVTGGYLLKIDRSGSGDATLNAGSASMVYVSPDGAELNAGLRNAQNTYIANYFNTFYSVLSSATWTNPTTGYAAYIDVDAAIDHHLLNVLSFNIDALRLSAYLYKPRNGKITMGPLWDYDRTLGSTDGRDFNPRRWRSGSPDYGTDMFNSDPIFNNPWYSKMFTDIDFWQKYIDRYQQLRRAQFSTNHLHALVDTLANQVRESQAREYVRWGGWNAPRNGTACDGAGAGYCNTFNGTYQGEIDFMKKWLADRVDFMDTNFLAPVSLSSTGGWVTRGFTVTLTPPAAPAGSTIYYTMDGTDPRAWNSGGQAATNAHVYTGPIVVTNNIRVVARAFNPAQHNLTGVNNPPISSSWSGPMAATYAVDMPSLRITEIMYHPLDATGATNTEYVEVKNISNVPLNVTGFHLSGAIDFVFPSLILAGGQYAVVVADIAAFQAKYGTNILIAGQFTGHLNNAGETLTLDGPYGENILNFAYDPAWYAMTDGSGFSLVIKDDMGAVNTWTNAQSWRPSTRPGGSPAAIDPPPIPIPLVVVNEAVAHMDPPDCDIIELYNTETNAADISGWFLTDDFMTPKKYRIPSGTVIPAGGYAVFYATNSFNNSNATLLPFGLSSDGDNVYVFSGDATTNLTGYSHGFTFGPSDYGVSFGRYVTSTGEEDFATQVTNSFGGANWGPKVGPVVIKEIMYHPPTNATTFVDNALDEYIELINISTAPVRLYNTNYPTNTWHLRGGISLDFPTNCILQPQETALLVNVDPLDPVMFAGFTNKYPLFAGKKIFGPYSGKLGNGGDEITLTKPGDTEPGGKVPRIIVEDVIYGNAAPWPSQADGFGPALVRRNLAAYGNDPTNWLVIIPLSIQIQPQSITNYLGSNMVANFTVTATGSGTLKYQWRFNGTNISSAGNPTATNATLVLTNLTVAMEGSYVVAVSDGVDTILSVAATFTPLMAPVIVDSPQHATIPVNGNASLAASAKGLPFPLYWKWVRNGLFVALVPTMDTNCTYYINGAQLSDGGDYQVTVTNALVGTNVAQTVRKFVTVVVPPASQGVAPGSNVTLQVTANCGRFTRYLSYQWQFNGTNISGATSSNLFLTNFQAAMSGAYSVSVINASNYVANFTAQVVSTALDSDGDGIPDWWEILHGLNPTNRFDALLDSDGDGMSNYAEYIAGTDPNDASSYLHLDIARIVPNGVVLEFWAVSNRTYQAWWNQTLATNSWNMLTNFTPVATNRTIIWTNTAPGAIQRYYRLVIPTAP